jgi:hypothetical protein
MASARARRGSSVKSGTGIIPEEFFDPSRIGDVMAFLMPIPIPGREKVDLLTAWAHAVGTNISSSRYAQMYNSGSDGPSGP